MPIGTNYGKVIALKNLMARYFTRDEILIDKQVVQNLKDHSKILYGKSDLTPLFKKIGNARIVMLGEATHGTHEFYTWRSYITRKLIEEKNFNFIAVEGDWPDCYRCNF
jgi:erythromycin esterase